MKIDLLSLLAACAAIAAGFGALAALLAVGFQKLQAQDVATENSTSSSDPVSLLRFVVRAVPGVKYVLSFAGVVTAVASIIQFKQEAVGTFIAIIVLLGMTGILALLQLIRRYSVFFRVPATIGLWVVLIVLTAAIAVTFSALVFRIPRSLSDIVGEIAGIRQESEPPEKIISPVGSLVAIQDLPAANRQEIPTTQWGENQVAAAVKMRPSLDLRDKVLFIPAGSSASRYWIVVNDLQLSASSKIVTNGKTLTIVANNIEANGADIVSFTEILNSAKKAVLGHRGASGGQVKLYVVNRISGPLHVYLPGQSGGDGENGNAGANGAAGAPGSSAADFILGCAHGPGPGNNGQPGQPGEDGRPGNDGGDGGILVVDNASEKVIPEIYFEAFGGKPGVGGHGGAGGLGGAGGSGGSGTVYCHGAPAGNQGPVGRTGNEGPAGLPGHDQTAIVRDSIFKN